MIFKLTKLRKTAQLDQDGKLSVKESWSGHSTYDACTVGLAPELDRSGDLATGLSESEARSLEKRLFLKEGTLNPDVDNPYWYTKFQIPFKATGIELDDTKPMDMLRLSVLRASKKVAVGREDLKRKSKAEYLLSSDEQVVKEDEQKLSVKAEAYILLGTLGLDKQRQILTVLSKKKKNGRLIDASSMSEGAVKVDVMKAIEANPSLFMEVAGNENLNTEFEILELVTKGVLNITSAGYRVGNEVLAPDLDQMVEFMLDPHNQPRVIQFKKDLKKANKA